MDSVFEKVCLVFPAPGLDDPNCITILVLLSDCTLSSFSLRLSGSDTFGVPSSPSKSFSSHTFIAGSLLFRPASRTFFSAACASSQILNLSWMPPGAVSQEGCPENG